MVAPSLYTVCLSTKKTKHQGASVSLCPVEGASAFQIPLLILSPGNALRTNFITCPRTQHTFKALRGAHSRAHSDWCSNITLCLWAAVSNKEKDQHC